MKKRRRLLSSDTDHDTDGGSTPSVPVLDVIQDGDHRPAAAGKRRRTTTTDVMDVDSDDYDDDDDDFVKVINTLPQAHTSTRKSRPASRSNHMSIDISKVPNPKSSKISKNESTATISRKTITKTVSVASSSHWQDSSDDIAEQIDSDFEDPCSSPSRAATTSRKRSNDTSISTTSTAQGSQRSRKKKSHKDTDRPASSPSSWKSRSTQGKMPMDSESGQASLKRWTVPGTRFRGPSNASSTNKKATLLDMNELWVDKFHPISEAELAVHSGKVSQMRNWLVEALSNPGATRRRILCLTGPSGSGKTAAIRVLASKMGIEMLEWFNPYNMNQFGENDVENEGDERRQYESITKRFAQFLERADKYPSLVFESTTQTCIPLKATNKPKIILIEDLPNVANNVTRTAIHTAIRSFARTPRSKFPLVFIISEVACIGGDLSSTSFRSGGDERKITIKDVIPPDIMTLGCVAEIKFNPVAPTLVKKCLTRICDVVYRTAAQKLIRPRPVELEWISKTCNGDIRCAINSLQFASLREPGAFILGNGRNGGKANKCIGGRSGNKKNAEVHQDDNQEEQFTMDKNPFTRDVSLTIFRVLGKFLYNKRMGDDDESEDTKRPGDKKSNTVYQEHEPEIYIRRRLDSNSHTDITKISDAECVDDEQRFKLPTPEYLPLPPYLAHYERKPFILEPERIVEFSHLEAGKLIDYLFQNYMAFYLDIDEVEVAAEYFSAADLFLASNTWRGPMSSYATSVTTRGLAFAHLTNLPATNPLSQFNGNSPPFQFRPFFKPQLYQVSSDIRDRDSDIRRGVWTWLTDAIKEGREMTPPSFDVSRVDLIPYLGKMFNKPRLSRFGMPEYSLPPYLSHLTATITKYPTLASCDASNHSQHAHKQVDENDMAEEGDDEHDPYGENGLWSHLPLTGRISSADEVRATQAVVKEDNEFVDEIQEFDDEF
ncbi:hypothetical protein SeMB42_g01284 [Synchytrium endobioticum]|uniref:AAA+ ATPase domain-containing protein n=1 Tax=Synchytrium endobioticum TaxID=286115 RepID=A0A507CXD1_9FUNG|nr:hypothetical protein SeLEV6574_g05015 [Synchytrium endobioticum]TPX52605.1 hypothetical protein SeMB42_g01284 [Synchytrium endobioticum]